MCVNTSISKVSIIFEEMYLHSISHPHSDYSGTLTTFLNLLNTRDVPHLFSQKVWKLQKVSLHMTVSSRALQYSMDLVNKGNILVRVLTDLSDNSV